MKLYFKPGACSMSSRIVLNELGADFDAIEVDTEKGVTKTGADYREINPKGYVPALQLAGGAVLTENPAILQFLADSQPNARLAPTAGTLERARLQEWLNFISSELHKAFSPYFQGRLLDAAEKERVDVHLGRRIGDVERGLTDGREFILGNHFSVADAYLFVVLSWSSHVGPSLSRWSRVAAYVARLASRPSIRQALLQEGLVSNEAVA